MKKADFLVIALVLLLSLGLGIAIFAASLPKADGSDAFLCISADGAESYYPMSGRQTVTVQANGHTMTVMIEEGSAFVAECDCRDKICVHSGKINRPHESILCAPAKILLTITDADSQSGGENTEEYDGIAR